MLKYFCIQIKNCIQIYIQIKNCIKICIQIKIEILHTNLSFAYKLKFAYIFFMKGAFINGH